MTNCKQVRTIGIAEWCALAKDGPVPPVTICLDGSSMMPLIRQVKDPVTIAPLEHPIRIGFGRSVGRSSALWEIIA